MQVALWDEIAVKVRISLLQSNLLEFIWAMFAWKAALAAFTHENKYYKQERKSLS